MSYLDSKPITELRSLAQFLGLKVNYGWDKLKLSQEIIRHTGIKPMPRPRLPDESPKAAARVIMNTISRDAVLHALEQYKEYGLKAEVVGDSVKLTHTTVKEDTVPLRNPLAVVIECARRLIHG